MCGMQIQLCGERCTVAALVEVFSSVSRALLQRHSSELLLCDPINATESPQEGPRKLFCLLFVVFSQILLCFLILQVIPLASAMTCAWGVRRGALPLPFLCEYSQSLP